MMLESPVESGGIRIATGGFPSSDDFITDLRWGSLEAEIDIHDLKSDDPLKRVSMKRTWGCRCDRCWRRQMCVVECRFFTRWVSRSAPQGGGRRWS